MPGWLNKKKKKKNNNNPLEINRALRLTGLGPNKPNIFFYDLLSSILFIISYLLPINEPHIYSLKYIGGHSMEMSIFLSLDFTEILHLKNTWLQFFIYIF